MRPLEIAVSILLAVYLFWMKPRPLGIKLAPALALLLALIHLAAEGYRWQMIPLYALTILLAAPILFQAEIPSPVSYVALVFLAAAVALPALLPVPKIPTPGGSYSIGTATYEMTDVARKEIYSGKDEARRFMIQVWYPAAIKPTDQQAAWMPRADVYAPVISDFLELPSFFLNHLALVKVPAYQNAQLVANETPFPLILFSHGWKGFNAQNTGQALELASRGFVVVAVQHTYGAITTVFPDGSVAPNNPNALPADDNAAHYEETARILAKQWSGDLAYALNQLEDPASETGAFFNSRVDFARVGVYGHSTGGGAAIQFCADDARCKAVLGMDPFMRPVSEEVIASGVSQPSFFMFSQGWVDDAASRNNELFHQFIPNAKNNLGVIEILGTKHHDFSDLPLLSPIAPQLGLKGPLNGARVVEISNAYLLNFFEETLNAAPSNLFEGKSPFVEVKTLR
ncbi:MAG: carboxylic ester hydrolase [Anaerolineales bacterium]